MASRSDAAPLTVARYPNRGFPKIFNDKTVGEEAKKLYDEARVMLADFAKNKTLKLTAIVGFYAANSVGDDIEVYTDDDRKTVTCRFCGLR